MTKNNTDKEYDKAFFENVPPMKLTECRRLKLHSESWGLLSNYQLESVKINRYKPNEVSSTAVLQVADESGQVTCIIKGKAVGLLFGLSSQEWSDIENMCHCGEQLFYRYFTKGLSSNFSCEQKLFYNFCLSNQIEDVFVAIFCRFINTRNKNKDDALLNIFRLRKLNSLTLDLYINHLRKVQK